jgi:hypothetical protein
MDLYVSRGLMPMLCQPIKASHLVLRVYDYITWACYPSDVSPQLKSDKSPYTYILTYPYHKPSIELFNGNIRIFYKIPVPSGIPPD